MFNLEIKKKSGSNNNPDIHNSKVPSSYLINNLEENVGFSFGLKRAKLDNFSIVIKARNNILRRKKKIFFLIIQLFKRNQAKLLQYINRKFLCRVTWNFAYCPFKTFLLTCLMTLNHFLMFGGFLKSMHKDFKIIFYCLVDF